MKKSTDNITNHVDDFEGLDNDHKDIKRCMKYIYKVYQYIIYKQRLTVIIWHLSFPYLWLLLLFLLLLLLELRLRERTSKLKSWGLKPKQKKKKKKKKKVVRWVQTYVKARFEVVFFSIFNRGSP